MKANNHIRAVFLEIEGDGAAAEAARQLSLFMPPARLGSTFDPVLDAERLTSNTARVLRLLLDGEPHTLEELRQIGGAQADRRARDLRSERLGAFDLRVYLDPAAPGSGRWFYQLVNPTEAQVWAALATLGIASPDHAAR